MRPILEIYASLECIRGQKHESTITTSCSYNDLFLLHLFRYLRATPAHHLVEIIGGLSLLSLLVAEHLLQRFDVFKSLFLLHWISEIQYVHVDMHV